MRARRRRRRKGKGNNMIMYEGSEKGKILRKIQGPKVK